MMIRKRHRSGTPGIGTPPAVGNHDSPDIQVSSAIQHADPESGSARDPSDDSPASRAAASAGTICSGRVLESSSVIAAARIPTIPGDQRRRSASWSAPSRVGERPRSMPETSFSDAARVASPKRVHRYAAAITTVATITIPR